MVMPVTWTSLINHLQFVFNAAARITGGIPKFDHNIICSYICGTSYMIACVDKISLKSLCWCTMPVPFVLHHLVILCDHRFPSLCNTGSSGCSSVPLALQPNATWKLFCCQSLTLQQAAMQSAPWDSPFYASTLQAVEDHAVRLWQCIVRLAAPIQYNKTKNL